MIKRKLLIPGVLILGTHALASAEQPLSSPVRLEIQSQSLDKALSAWAEQTGYQVLIQEEHLDDARTSAPIIDGTYTPESALKLLLASTHLEYRFVNARTVAIRTALEAPSAQRVGSDRDKAESLGATSETLRFADAGGESNVSPDGPSVASTSNDADKGVPGNNKKAAGISEVIVTATKREERVQDVPMSLAVVGSEDIERRGLMGMEDYLRTIPGVNQIDRGSIDNSIVIRGITTSPEFENAFSSATVASYFGETPITGAAGPGAGGIDVRPVDIERIEVLRGPQGTTFGDASLGGTVRLIPVKPQLDAFSAKLSTDYSNTSGFGGNNSMIQGVVNVPLVTGKFALRVVGYYYDESGYYRNVVGSDPVVIGAAQQFGLGSYVSGFFQSDLGRMFTRGGRAELLWNASDSVDVAATFLTQRIEQDGFPFVTLGSTGTYQQEAFPVAPQSRIRGEVGNASDNSLDISNVLLRWDLGWGALTSSASWVDSRAVSATAEVPEFISFVGPASSTDSGSYRSFVTETRLASHFSGPLQFLGGVFYENVHDGLLGSLVYPGTLDTNPAGTNPEDFSASARHLEQYAVFGNVSYALTDHLTATVGARYFRYDKSTDSLTEGGLLGVPLGTGTVTALQGSENHSTYEADLSYKPTKETLFYAHWSQGFRLGYPTSPVPADLCDTNHDGVVDGTNDTVASTGTVASDSLDNYEIGSKVNFANGRAAVNVAVYHIVWRGLPVTITPACFFSFTSNAGAAVSNGIEFESSFIVAKGLKLDAGVGLTRAHLTEGAADLGAPDDARLPGSPRFNANLSAQYDFHLGGRSTFVRIDSAYSGTFYGDLSQTTDLQAGGYTKIDARAGMALQNINVELFVRNLTNADAWTWRDPYVGYRLRPRTGGVQLTYNF